MGFDWGAALQSAAQNTLTQNDPSAMLGSVLGQYLHGAMQGKGKGKGGNEADLISLYQQGPDSAVGAFSRAVGADKVADSALGKGLFGFQTPTLQGSPMQQQRYAGLFPTQW